MSPFTRAFIKIANEKAEEKPAPPSNFPQDREYYKVREGFGRRLKSAGGAAAAGGVAGGMLGSAAGVLAGLEELGDSRMPIKGVLRHVGGRTAAGAAIGAGVGGVSLGALRAILGRKRVFSVGAGVPKDKKEGYFDALRAKGYKVDRTDMPDPF